MEDMNGAAVCPFTRNQLNWQRFVVFDVWKMKFMTTSHSSVALPPGSQARHLMLRQCPSSARPKNCFPSDPVGRSMWNPCTGECAEPGQPSQIAICVSSHDQGPVLHRRTSGVRMSPWAHEIASRTHEIASRTDERYQDALISLQIVLVVF